MNGNSVILTGHYGSDEIHALSAWTSTSRDISEKKRERIPELLKFLAQNGHHTPFEKSYLQFLVTADTASHIHLLKHRIGVSINGESARYKEIKQDKYYVPQDWPDDLKKEYVEHLELTYSKYHRVLKDLEDSGFSRKRAKESARFYLPYGNTLVLDVSFNWRSFNHFLGLRKKEEAQDEIHEIASEMLRLVKTIDGHPFKHTIDAFCL
jgi:thymidylate synthase (FAD)